MKLGKAYYATCVTPENNWLPTKITLHCSRIRMSPTPTLNIYLFEGPILQGILRAIMSPIELKMQRTIHLQS
jgi:hypothetical protein